VDDVDDSERDGLRIVRAYLGEVFPNEAPVESYDEEYGCFSFAREHGGRLLLARTMLQTLGGRHLLNRLKAVKAREALQGVANGTVLIITPEHAFVEPETPAD